MKSNIDLGTAFIGAAPLSKTVVVPTGGKGARLFRLYNANSDVNILERFGDFTISFNPTKSGVYYFDLYISRQDHRKG